MTRLEKILNILEINENVPALVVDDSYNILTSNEAWKYKNGNVKEGKNFLKLFDKNTSLLVQNSFLDSKTFVKIQRREVPFGKNKNLQTHHLIISPFEINEQLYFYVLLFAQNIRKELFIYPSSDDATISSKYNRIIDELTNNYPKTVIEKKNFQFNIDIKRESIIVKDRNKILFIKNNLIENFEKEDVKTSDISLKKIFSQQVYSKFQLAEEEVFNLKLLFIIESADFNPKDIHEKNRMILYPILDVFGEVDKIIIFGSLDIQNGSNSKKIETSGSSKSEQKSEHKNSLNSLSEARIVYDKNTFDILDANNEASNIYGYEADELKQMNVTELYPPEEMQLLLSPITQKSTLIVKQLTKSSEIVTVELERANLVWNGNEACMVIIKVTDNKSEEIIDNESNEEAGKPFAKDIDTAAEEIIKKEKSETPKEEGRAGEEETQPVNDVKTGERKSAFLSSLFHELLTPVNVILGFVQEIIDSIDNPSEEQQESADIIKDNQQLLLQTMNTAVQYAQLEENKIKINIEEFDINNSLVDLQDSFSRTSEKENTIVVFDDIPESLLLKNDRNKLLAAISYFIKFVIKLTDASKVFVSFRAINNQLYLLIKDSDSEISGTVLSDIIEIYNSDSLSDKKNYGISSITIKLARKLNELLFSKVIEYSELNGNKVIAFTTPLVLEEQATGREERVTIEKEEPVEEVPAEKKIDETEAEEVIQKSEIEGHEDIVSETPEHIANGEIDEKIIEDIHGEKEIITEEIATIEEVNDKILDLSNLSCLFIDDTVDSQLLFKSQMKDFKLLKVSSNLHEALPLLNKYDFDVIFVDINLNDKYNGFDVLKILRQFDNYKTTPVIAVTAYSFDGDKEQFLNFGFTDYLVKPLLRDQLVKSLEQILA